MTGRITGLGSYLPEKILTNDDLAKMVDTSDEWIMERTGISTRHISDHIKELPSYMGGEAAKRALEDAGVDASEIDLIVVSCSSPDKMFPSMACYVQKAIGNDGCACFDVSSACPGWITAFNTAQCFIESGNARKALVVGTECLSNYVDWTDRSTCILFGDGAGAAVLEADDSMPRNQFIMHATSNKAECLVCEARMQPDRWEEEGFFKNTFFQMAGRDVFRFAVTEVPKVITELSEKCELNLDDIDWFILHQANARIIETIAKRLGQDISKFPMTVYDTGNISTASMPALMDRMKREGKLKKGQKIILSSFGAGLTWAASYIEF
ncbi:3-oxoacyl-[acyl-carrier-protein] synthase-3 [Ruminococcaceae bacterium YRB3002]|nr:3-oxoacyl-[acyl-carrier-protein] synthase-3 [Ruminococcaceae bacterium YRB3002]